MKFEDVRCSGAGPEDVIYTHESLGSFNVSSMLLFLSHPSVRREKFAIHPQIIFSNSKQDCSEELVRTMSEARRDEPLVGMIEEPQHLLVVMDGNNRLRRRIRDKLDFFEIFIFPQEMILKLFPVKIEGLYRGRWYDVSKMIPDWGRHIAPGSEEDKRLRARVDLRRHFK